MLSHAEIVKLNKIARERKLRIIFKFKNYKYCLVLDGVIHAESIDKKRVSWNKAFGSKIPSDVLTTYQLDKIIIKTSNEEKVLRDLNELKRMII